MNELIKVTFALRPKEQLEGWVSEILQEGWELSSFRYVMLGSLMNFRCRGKTTACAGLLL